MYTDAARDTPKRRQHVEAWRGCSVGIVGRSVGRSVGCADRHILEVVEEQVEEAVSRASTGGGTPSPRAMASHPSRPSTQPLKVVAVRKLDLNLPPTSSRNPLPLPLLLNLRQEPTHEKRKRERERERKREREREREREVHAGQHIEPHTQHTANRSHIKSRAQLFIVATTLHLQLTLSERESPIVIGVYIALTHVLFFFVRFVLNYPVDDHRIDVVCVDAISSSCCCCRCCCAVDYFGCNCFLEIVDFSSTSANLASG